MSYYGEIIIIIFSSLIKIYACVLQDEKNQLMQVSLWIRQVIILRTLYIYDGDGEGDAD